MPRNAAEVLVVPQLMSGWEYRGIVITQADGPARSVLDLEDGTLALTDPESLTGCLMPSALLLSLVPEPGDFFSRVLFTGSHDRAVSAVAGGLVDAAAVNGLIYHALCKENERIAGNTRVIWQSDVYGPPPILVPRDMPQESKDRIRAALLALHEDDEGFAVFRSLGIRRFIPPSEGDYETARELYERVMAAGGCPWL
jgi:phosphonate transport system substrate-binding protein